MRIKWKLILPLATLLLALLPLTAAAYMDTASYNLRFGDALDYAERRHWFGENSNLEPEKEVGKAEFMKIILQFNGFEPIPEVTTDFEGVDPEYVPYVERMRELGYLYYNQFEPSLDGERPYALWRSAAMLMKLEGVPVPKLFNTYDFANNFPGYQANAFYGPTMYRAYQLGLVQPTKLDANPLRKLTRIDLVVMLYNIHLYEQSVEQVINDGPAATDDTKQIVIQRDPRLEHPLVQNDKFPILLDVWDKITTNYYTDQEIDEDELIYGAIEGLVERLDDPYTVYQDPEVAAAFNNSLSNEVQGIGASLGKNDAGEIFVVTPIVGSPAEKAGIQPGDIIVQVDGRNVGNLSLAEVVRLIQGPSGSKVQLLVKTGSTSRKLSVTRARISVPSVTGEVTEDNILLVKISNFGFGTTASFDNIVSQVEGQDLDAIILDLRNNPGGLLSSAVEIASYFVDKGKVVTRIQGTKVDESEKSAGPATFAGTPIYILTNGGTASAAEILAGALNDHNNAVIVGKRTFGKGTVQELSGYIDGSSFKYTIARWLTPSGQSINHIGIPPDIEVDFTESDRAAGIDPQLNRALREIRF